MGLNAYFLYLSTYILTFDPKMPPSGSASSKSGPSQQGEKPKRTTPSAPRAPRHAPILPEQGESSRQSTASAPVAPKDASTRAPAPQQRKPQLPKPFPPVSTQPLLSIRQMQELASPFPYSCTLLTISSLLRGNRGSRVSVQVENAYVCSILRPVAKHFSRTWRQALANIHCTSVNVTVPTPAPSRNATTAPAGNAPESSDAPPAVAQEDPSPTPSERNAVTFIVQWMEQGGADPVGPSTLVYPRGSEEELVRLQGLATALGVDPLVKRTRRDIAAIRGAKCDLCKQPG